MVASSVLPFFRQDGKPVEFLAVANWLKYQHYGLSRKAPWIKIHLALLEKPEFVTMPDVQRSHLLLLWLLALKLENKIPNNPAYVRKLICAEKKVDLQAFINAGWLVSYSEYKAGLLAYNNKLASKVLADSSDGASKPSHDLRVESREKRVEKNIDKTDAAPKAQRGDKFNPTSLQVPDWLVEPWATWCNHRKEIRHPITKSQAETLIKKLVEWGPDRSKTAINHSVANGWQGLFEPKRQGRENMSLKDELQIHKDFAADVMAGFNQKQEKVVNG